MKNNAKKTKKLLPLAVLIADDVQVNGCIALGTLDGVGALGQILPYGVQARR